MLITAIIRKYGIQLKEHLPLSEYAEREVLIYRTNLSNQQEVKSVQRVLDRHPSIHAWSVDTQDVDKVLRIEAALPLSEQNVVNLITAEGFECEALAG